eukprot:m51a1_g11204 putative protein (206) ;mRNA; f:27157-28166
MLRLKEIQKKQAEEKKLAASSPPPASSSPKAGPSCAAQTAGPAKKGPQQSIAEMRAQKDISEMDKCPGTTVSFPDPDNLMKMCVRVRPGEGFYAGAEFSFAVSIPPSYPFDPPKVHCDTLVYHPNIDWDGHVCLNILRQDWMPVLSVGSVIFGLLSLFLEPNADDPLNKEAAEVMTARPKEFERTVRATLRGGQYFGRRFPKLIA